MFKQIKRVTMLLFVAATIINVSCDKNDDNGSGNGNDTEVLSSLVGTKWSEPVVTATDSGLTLKFGFDCFFSSSTSVHIYRWVTIDDVIYTDATENFDCTYVYHAPSGTIYENGKAVNFVIDGNVMILIYPDGTQYALERQR